MGRCAGPAQLSKGPGKCKEKALVLKSAAPRSIGTTATLCVCVCACVLCVLGGGGGGLGGGPPFAWLTGTVRVERTFALFRAAAAAAGLAVTEEEMVQSAPPGHVPLFADAADLRERSDGHYDEAAHENYRLVTLRIEMSGAPMGQLDAPMDP